MALQQPEYSNCVMGLSDEVIEPAPLATTPLVLSTLGQLALIATATSLGLLGARLVSHLTAGVF